MSIQSPFFPRFSRLGRLSLLGIVLCLGGCQTLSYYAQAVKGQVSLLADRQPIEDLLQSKDTAPKLRARLSLVQNIRAFARTDLGLPADRQYDSYVELGRPYPVWTVTATPELSLTPKSWCYWFVGCLSYRGYFNQSMAADYGAGLHAQGYDVYVDGMPAYSTLGWFRDPVLSSFIYQSDAYLSELIFHELAHQLLFVPGDTTFNESFAVTVADVGLERYAKVHALDLDKLRLANARHAQFVSLVLEYRKRLEQAFAAPASDAEKRAAKVRIYAELQAAYVRLRAEWGGYAGYDPWFTGVNNAKLNTVATYYDDVPGLKALLASKQGDLPAFYAACRQLAKLSPEQRRQQLQALTVGKL